MVLSLQNLKSRKGNYCSTRMHLFVQTKLPSMGVGAVHFHCKEPFFLSWHFDLSFHHNWNPETFLHDQTLSSYCLWWLTSSLFCPLGLPFLRRNSCVTHRPRSGCILVPWFNRTFELCSLRGPANPTIGTGKQTILCSLTFNLVSLPNLHPLWPDHISLTVDSSAGLLIFSP